VADVVRMPGLFEQIRLVAGLRWKILRNGLRNKNRRWDLIGVIISSIMGVILISGLSFAIYFGTYTFVQGHHPERITLLFWAIFVWWQILPIFVAGFSPSFSFHTLLRFPLKLSAFYLIGIAYGLADSAAVASLLWLCAMTLATAFADSSMLPGMILACVLFVAVNVTLERWIGSWVEKLMSKRRSRELFLVLFILCMTSLQFIGPAIEKYQRSTGKTGRQESIERIVKYARPLPASLAGRILTASSEHDISSAAIASAGLTGYAVLFGALLFARYKVQYLGEELNEAMAPSRKRARLWPRAQAATEHGVASEIRILPATVSAVLMKEIRYLLRNGFAAMLLFLPPMLVLLFSAQFGGAHPMSNHPVSPTYFFPGMMAYLVLMLMAPSYNSFAFEGRGMQTYFMVPVKFRDVLLGKNLMTLVIMAFEISLSVAVLQWRVGLPPLSVFLATMSALVFAVVGQLTIANWSSLTFPKKMDFGKMQGNRQSGMAVLVTFGAQIVFGGTSAVIFMVCRLGGNDWLPVGVFLFLAIAALAGYWSSLEPLTKLAEQKKESLLETLTK
jgi:ABC-2 type transport system permease protein